MYLTVLVGGLAAFIFCSFWVYHYVDLGLDTNEEEESDEEDIDSSMVFRNFSPFVEHDVASRGLPGHSTGPKTRPI